MNEPISGALDRLTTKGGRVIVVLRAQARNLMLRILAPARPWMRAAPVREPAEGAAAQPVSGALVKLTNEGRKVILALPGHGRALVQRAAAVQIELRKLSRGRACLPKSSPAFRCRPGHRARLWKARPWPVRCEASSLHRSGDSDFRCSRKDRRRHPQRARWTWVLFRLRNIRLVDEVGSILAQHLPAIGMSGSAFVGPHRARECRPRSAASLVLRRRPSIA